MYPNSTNTRHGDGSSRYSSWVNTPAPSGNCAVVGNNPSPSEKTTMKNTAQTNSGIAVAESPPTEIRRSRKLPSWIAAVTPPAIASGTTITNASSASLPEATSGSNRTSDTGRFWTDSPRSPVTKFENQSQYWVSSGSLAPSSSFSASTDA